METTMKKLVTILAVVAACGGCSGAGQVVAQEDGGGATIPIPEWAQKGPEHDSMKKWVGDWDVAQKMWMMPGQPPMESTATSSTSALWDGRYLESDFKGDMMGTPFDGRLLMGFDRADSEWVSVWIDSMSTYISVSRGVEKDGKLTFVSNDPDWTTGEKKEAKMIIEWTSEDQYVLSFIGDGPDGKPLKSMEMTYTRRKSD
jgi:hypothetical protein